MKKRHAGAAALAACLAAALLLFTCVTPRAAGPATSALPPEPVREFRALWVATVGNLDWPSSRGLPIEAQKAEADAILDQAKALGFNTILFQARPAADAFYRSEREPWSVFLTGTIGQDPGWDPLAYWIEGAHRRGLQLHAWINPFRAGYPAIKPADYNGESLAERRPELVRTVGAKGYRWIDPGQEGAQEHVLAVIGDLLAYDLDGIVLDDYFYPYRDFYAPGEDFDDDASFAAARAAGWEGGRADWRRANLDRFVSRLYGQVKAAKPELLVGIAPFGIWRPDYPAGIRGKDSLAEIHADSRLWLRAGWLDWIAPQLYWPRRQEAQSFDRLLAWWYGENAAGRHVWPALNPGYASSAWRPDAAGRAAELAAQIGQLRSEAAGQGKVPGMAVFRARSLVTFGSSGLDADYLGTAVAETLRDETFAEPALVPASPWTRAAFRPRPFPAGWDTVDAAVPAALEPARLPVVDAARAGGDAAELALAADPGAFLWLVQAERKSGMWETVVVPSAQRRVVVPALADDPVRRLAVRAVGRDGGLSAPTWIVP